MSDKVSNKVTVESVEPMTTSEVIDCMIDVLQDGGWRKLEFGPTYKPSAPHCVIGTWRVCNWKLHPGLIPGRVYGAFHNLFTEFEKKLTPVVFNDHYCQSKDEMVATLLALRNIAAKRGD